MPFYSSSALLRWRARGILSFVLETGSFGHNRNVSYFKRNPYLVRKVFSFWRRSWDNCWQMLIFPVGGTFDSDIPGTFESDTGGTFNPLLSEEVYFSLSGPKMLNVK